MAISNSEGGDVVSKTSYDGETQVSPVKEIERITCNRNENEPLQALSILELSVIGRAEDRVLKNRNISRANGEALSQIGNTTKIEELCRRISN